MIEQRREIERRFGVRWDEVTDLSGVEHYKNIRFYRTPEERVNPRETTLSELMDFINAELRKRSYAIRELQEAADSRIRLSSRER